MVKQQVSSNFQAQLKESEILTLCHEKTSAQKSIIGKGGVSQEGCPFLGGLRSEWMKSGHWGRGGQKRPKIGGRPLYTVPR